MARPQLSEERVKHYGEPLKYDPQFKGPTIRRSCTDILCLLLFVVFIIAWIGIAAYAYRFGDPKKLATAIDSEGRRCGLDSDVLDKKNLLFFDLSQCSTPTVLLSGCSTTQICIDECPKHSWAAFPSLDSRYFDLKNVQENLICKNENIKKAVTNPALLKVVIDEGACASWYLSSTPIHKRCLPIVDELKSGKDWLQKIGLIEAGERLTNSTATIHKFARVNEYGSELIQDLINTWPYIIAGIAASAFVSLIVIILLRWVACLVTWLTLIAVVVLLGVGAYFSYKKYDYLDKNGPILSNKRMLEETLDDIWNRKELWMFFTILCSILGVIVLLLIIFLRKRISIAITLIKEGSKAVGSVMSTLFFPIVPWLLQALVIMWAVAVGVFLSSIGDPVYKTQVLKDEGCICTGASQYLKNGDICDPNNFKDLCHSSEGVCKVCRFFGRETTNLTIILQLINAFGAFWGVWFMSGVCYMIMAATFATWYWTWNKNDLPFFTLTQASFRTMRYHLGTVAFGSLIISICSFIRAIIEYLEKKLKGYENAVAKALFCCLKCFFWCLERFLRFISRNAYIMCAIHGKNFCVSAKDAFNLLMRNVIRVVVLDKVTDFLFFVGKMFVTAIVVGGAYLFVFRHPYVVDVNHIWLPLLIIGLSSYFVATMFFGVYAMAVDTLFLCFLEDCERNDGSPEKPYFMSKSLMQILGKRNKRNK